MNDLSENIQIQFVINYVKDEGGNWEINIELSKAPEDEYTFYFGPNNERNNFCIGNDTFKRAECIWKNISTNVSANFEMIFTFHGMNGIIYEGLIVGKIIYAFGNYYKNFEIPYTVDDPCWTKSAELIPFSNATYHAIFCCTKFDKDAPTSTINYETSSSTLTSSATTTTTFISTTEESETLNTEGITEFTTADVDTTSAAVLRTTIKIITSKAAQKYQFNIFLYNFVLVIVFSFFS
uniref:Uncharacterized protein n=1 Tax=Panagrolaimus sp. ES5 TaxID=591445 RepID=A0AC34FXE6_9BILA